MATKTRSRTTRAADANIRHLIYLQRYNSGVVRRMMALLNRTDADIVARMLRLANAPGQAAALEGVLAEVRGLNVRLGRALRTGLIEAATDLAEHEGAFAVEVGRAATGVSWNGATIEQVRAAAMSRPFQGVHLAWAALGEHMDELTDRRGALVRDTIRRGFVQGDSVDELVRRLRGTRALGYRDGMLEASRRTTETIVRTALNHTATASREEVYKLNGHLIRGVRWTSVLDGRTSAVCRGRDGTIYPPDQGPRPPAHPNCRSTTVPIFRGDPEPEVPSYGEWLKDQDSEFIRDLLGETKGKLFLDGNLTLDRFVDRNGREYSINELRQRDRSAFERAGIT